MIDFSLEGGGAQPKIVFKNLPRNSEKLQYKGEPYMLCCIQKKLNTLYNNIFINMKDLRQ